MRKTTKLTLAIIPLLAGMLLAGCFGPAVMVGYQNTTETGGVIEKKYTASGQFQVKSTNYTVNEAKFKNIKVWYPADLETTSKQYPVVIFANGTGVVNTSYEEVFKHLASWGFIAIGNDDKNSWDGYSSSKSLDLILEEGGNSKSVFFHKVNTRQIGLSGHSQGGVGVINAYTKQLNGKYYRSIFGASTTKLDLAVSLKWPYDVSKVNVPYFMVAGTGAFDGGNTQDKNSGIAPLWSLKENFQKLSSGALSVMARRKNTDHGKMLYQADGYMTAWFFHTLLGNEEAGKAFTGSSPEIMKNRLWMDVAVRNAR